MMIPEAWQNDTRMPEEKRAFYEFNSALMEPWDGPASVAFTDGKYIGAVLDRNGLRPSRYYLTHDDKVIMASEVGVLQVDPENVKAKGRLQPGKMFLIDFEQGRMIPDEELKHEFAARHPYHEWLANQRIALSVSRSKTCMFSMLKTNCISSPIVARVRGSTRATNSCFPVFKKRKISFPISSVISTRVSTG